MKPKRVSDVNAMGAPVSPPPGFNPGPQVGFSVPTPPPGFEQVPGGFPQQNQGYYPGPSQTPPPGGPSKLNLL